MAMKREEAKLIQEIKKAAKTNPVRAPVPGASAKVLAKQLVRLRASMAKLHGAKAQLRSVGTAATTMQATHTVSNAVKGASKAMSTVSKTMPIEEQQKMLQQFAKQNEEMEYKQEILGDTLDDALDTDELEEESDDVMNQVCLVVVEGYCTISSWDTCDIPLRAVLDEIGIDIAGKLNSAGTASSRLPAQEATEASTVAEDEALMKRLAALRSA
eukprot:scaffold7379_cov366-Prasinococcus_capsulatus_cf.AAC.9